MRKALITFLATGTYTGLAPFMPGTFGTLWGVVIAWIISGQTLPAQALVTAVVIAVSVFISGQACAILGRHDHSSIVIDEVSGYLVSIFLIPFTVFNAILVFILFRFFDIVKPWPVRSFDRNIKGGTGVVLDDLAAGVYANLSAHIVLWQIGQWTI